MIGCSCETCRSTDSRDSRWRPSILIEHDSSSILVDTTPDLRAQALRFGVTRVDAILYTHSHADHVMGLDEVRRYNWMQRDVIPCFGDRRTVADIRRTFWYVFEHGDAGGGGVPMLAPFVVQGPFCIAGLELVPIPILHGQRPILGYRVGQFAYLTDCSAIPDASWPLLDGIDTLVVGALRARPHPTHFSVGEALQVAERLSPSHTYFTHICHDLPHEATCRQLPSGVELAYDGLAFEI
jgi:phosphoribosyl 1,2-cyclic phosphate phosphodiesterase